SRRRKEKRKRILDGRPPEHRVVREHAVVRIEARDAGNPPPHVVEKEDAEPDPPEPEASRIELAVDLDGRLKDVFELGFQDNSAVARSIACSSVPAISSPGNFCFKFALIQTSRGRGRGPAKTT